MESRLLRQIVEEIRGKGMGDSSSAIVDMRAANVTAFAAPSTPSAPTVTPVGTTGAATYSYARIINNGNADSAQSTATQITNGNAILDGTNYNTISWGALSAGQTVTLIRTVVSGGNPSSTGQIATGLTGTSFDDTGITAIAYVAAPNYLTINFGTATPAFARYLSTYSPVINDRVFLLLTLGGDILVLGRLA